MADKKRVLITGASGLIGGVLRESLRSSCDLSGIDIRPSDGFRLLVADMTDRTAIRPAFEGIDAVIDLANKANLESPWDDIYKNNVPATYNALEAACRADVQRIIFASSNHVTDLYENDYPYSAIVGGHYDHLDPSSIPCIASGDPIRPDSPYGIGKALGEAAGRYFSDTCGLSVICLRIGTVNKENRPLNPRHFATLFTHRDLTQLVERCLAAPQDLRFAIFFGVSDNRWRIWDISNSGEAIGYAPQDNAESWR